MSDRSPLAVPEGVRRLSPRPLAVVLLALAAVPGCQDQTGPQYVDDLVVTPDTVSLEVGSTTELRVLPMGPRGEEYPERAARVEWSVLNEDVVKGQTLPEGGFRVTSLDVGSARVTASLGRGYAEARVNVLALLPDRVAIEPTSVTLGPGNTSTRVQATLFRDGEVLAPEDYDFSWSGGDSRVILVISEHDKARIIARSAGTTWVRVSVAGVASQVPVTVEQ